MKKLGNDLDIMIAQLSGNDEQARINLRARQVRERYKSALETVYKEQAALFLAHTNNVYIINKDGFKTLIVYVDESIFAAELNAQRELIKLILLQLFEEEIEQFDIFVSRGNYKNNHPYLVVEDEYSNKKVDLAPLTEDEEREISETVSIVEDDKIRNALKSAITADFQLKKSENDQYPNN